MKKQSHRKKGEKAMPVGGDHPGEGDVTIENDN